MDIRGIFASALLLSVFYLNSTSIALAEECKTLKATGNSEYPPYLWRPDSNSKKLVGAIDFIMAEIGTRLNQTIKLQHVGAWSRAQEEVKSGRVDLLAGAFYTIPRNQWMDYVYPAFLSTNSVVWQNKNREIKFTEKQDLVGKLGVTVINNSFGQAFDEFAKQALKIEFVASLEQAFKMLALKRVDYALYEKYPGLSYVDQMGMSDKLNPVSPPVSSEGLYLTISHNSKCNTGKLRGQLAKVIREMINDGYVNKALSAGLTLRNEIQSR